MIVSTNAGIINSYNSGRITRSSYGTFINGQKFNIDMYGTSDPGEAYLYYELYLKYLVINDDVIVSSETLLGNFDDLLSEVNYRDDGYGLGNTTTVDILNNSDFFTFKKYDIIFYPGGNSQNGFTVETREKTRVLAAFRDFWDFEGTSMNWTLIMNYPKTNEFPDKELVIADLIGDFSSVFDYKDLGNLNEEMVIWN
jgi:hypothetical protein